MAIYLRNKKLMKLLGIRIRELRKSRNITMLEFAKKAGIEYVQLCRIESGLVNTSISHVYIIAKSLKIKLKDLFNFDL